MAARLSPPRIIAQGQFLGLASVLHAVRIPFAVEGPRDHRDLRQYLHVLRKRWRLIASVLRGQLGRGLVFTIRQPKIYEATCSLVIESTRRRYWRT